MHSWCLVLAGSRLSGSSVVGVAEAGHLAYRSHRGPRLPTGSYAPVPTVVVNAIRPTARHPKTSAPPLWKKIKLTHNTGWKHYLYFFKDGVRDVWIWSRFDRQCGVYGGVVHRSIAVRSWGAHPSHLSRASIVLRWDCDLFCRRVYNRPATENLIINACQLIIGGRCWNLQIFKLVF